METSIRLAKLANQVNFQYDFILKYYSLDAPFHIVYMNEMIFELPLENTIHRLQTT